MPLELDEIDPTWTETHHFTDDEVDEAYELGKERFENATLNLKRGDGDDIEMNAFGFLGEWAVDDALGYPRSKDVSGHTDKGIDLVLDSGRTLQIKFSAWRGAGFMIFCDRAPMAATYGVLTCPARHLPRCVKWPVKAVDIVGGFGLLEWHDLRQKRNFGKGPTWTVWPRFLVPWARLRESWTRVEEIMPSLPAQQLAL